MQIFAGQFCKLLNLKLPRMIKIWTVCVSSRTKEFYIQQHLESFSLSAIWGEAMVKNPYSIWKSYRSKWSFWWERWCWLPWAMNTWTWCICLFSNPAIKSVPMQQNVKFHAYPLSGNGHIHRHTCLRIIRQSFTVVLLNSKIFASDSESSGNLLNVALLEPQGAYEPLWKPVSIPMWRWLASPKSINGSLGGSLRIWLWSQQNSPSHEFEKETLLQVLPTIENTTSSCPAPGGFEGYHLYITLHRNLLILQSFDSLQGWIRISITMTGQFWHKKKTTRGVQLGRWLWWR